jgi:DNA polymerase-1
MISQKGASEKGIAPWQSGGDALTRYNAADVFLTSHLWEALQPDLATERHVYESDKRVALMCMHMRQTGLRVDLELQDQLSRSLKARKAALLGEMRKLVGKKSFSPSRLLDVRWALFQKFGAVSLRPTAKGMPSTSNETLGTLRVLPTRAGKLADYLLRWRGAGKVKATFVDGPAIDPSGRVHPGWKLGPVTGRLACSPYSVMNLPRFVDFEKGGDLESQVRALYIPGKGRSFVYFDLSQAEARAAAHISGDEKLIEACKKDIHAANAIVVFPEARELLLADPKGKGKRFRDVAKNCGFAVWYKGSAERVFITLRTLGFDVDMSECEALVDKFRAEYRRYYEFVDENLRQCHRVGHLRSWLLGRVRWLGFYAPETEVSNFPVQSFIADLMNTRLPEIEDRLPAGAHLVAQIHDASIIEVPHRSVERVKKLVADVWARPIKIPSNGLEFTMPIDLKDGSRWSDF